MKINTRSVLTGAALGLLLIAGCGKQAKWETFSSPIGGFSVLAPETPKEMKKTVNTAVGPVDAYFFIARQRTAAYTAGYSDYPSSMVRNSNPDEILDNSRDGAVANIQGKLLSELIITLGRYPGREIKVETPDGKSTMRARIYLVNNRLYQLIVATTRENALSPDVTRFLDSFKLDAP